MIYFVKNENEEFWKISRQGGDGQKNLYLILEILAEY